MRPPLARDVNEAMPENACSIWPDNEVTALPVLFRLRLRNALCGAPPPAYCDRVTATFAPLMDVVVLELLFVAVMVDALEVWAKARMEAALASDVMPKPQATTAAEAAMVQEEARRLRGISLSIS